MKTETPAVKTEIAQAAETAAVNKKSNSWRDFERKNDNVTRADVYKVPLSLIKVKKGFNPRDLDKPETRAKIANIKEAYKRGEYVTPIEAAIDGGVVLIVDGECRFTAAQQAHKELLLEKKDGLEHLIVLPSKGTALERKIRTHKANEGEKLTQLEQATLVRDLQLGDKAEGIKPMDRESIANLLNFSVSWVDKLIVLAKMPDEVKQLVIDGKIAPDVAADYFKKHKDAAFKELMALLEGKKDGDKVTKKDTKKKGDDDDEGGGDEKPKSEKQIMKERTMEIGQTLPFELRSVFKSKRDYKVGEEYTFKVTGRGIHMLMDLNEFYTEPE